MMSEEEYFGVGQVYMFELLPYEVVAILNSIHSHADDYEVWNLFRRKQPDTSYQYLLNLGDKFVPQDKATLKSEISYAGNNSHKLYIIKIDSRPNMRCYISVGQPLDSERDLIWALCYRLNSSLWSHKLNDRVDEWGLYEYENTI